MNAPHPTPSRDGELPRVPEDMDDLDKALSPLVIAIKYAFHPEQQDFAEEITEAKDALRQLIAQECAARELTAQTNAVAWCIGVVDELHISPMQAEWIDADKTYKGLKNTMRDQYKDIAGVDPAPTYPVRVQLTQAQRERS